MAKVKRKSRKLSETHLKYLLLSLLGYGLSIASAVSTIIFLIKGVVSLTIVCFLGIFFFVWLGGYMNKNAKIVASGIKGERETENLIKKLPNGYTAFTNINVTYQGKNSEIDTVVVGKGGVFVIETKNPKGIISGNYDDQNWLQTKHMGKQTHQKTFYNPRKQVGTHVYRLANFLRSSGVKANVTAAVYFSNPEATLSLSGNPGEIPVFCYSDNGENALLKFIKNGGEAISETEVKKIIKILSRC